MRAHDRSASLHESGRPVAVLGPRHARGLRGGARAGAPAAPRSGPGTTTPPAREAAAPDDLPISTRCDWRVAAALVLSPGIPHSFPEPHPVAARPRRPACPMIGDIELLCRAPAAARYRRHHRHQRQIDHHGADRPYPGDGRRKRSRSAAISARRRSLWRRWARTASMCWSCPPTSSSWCRRSRFDVARAAQHHARPSRPPRRHGGLCRRQGADLRAPEGGDWAVIGIDDEPSRRVRRRAAAAAGTSSPCPVGSAVRRRRLSCTTAGCAIDARAPRSSICGRAPALPGRAQLAERGRGLCRGRGRWACRPSEIVAGLETLSAASPIARSWSPTRRRRRASSTTARRPMPTPRPRRWPATTPIYWILGGRAEGGRARRRSSPIYPRVRHAYPDRRGGGGFRHAGCRAWRRHDGNAARWTAPSPPRWTHAAAEHRPGAVGAAVAGLRLLRPVRRISRSAAIASAALVEAFAGRDVAERRHERFRPHRPAACSAAGGGPSTAGRWSRLPPSSSSALFSSWPPARRWRLRSELDSFYLVRHHFALLPAGALIMLGVSLLRAARHPARRADRASDRAGAHGRSPSSSGMEIKGARRWIDLAGLVAAAVGIREAVLRGHRRLAVRGAARPARAFPAISSRSCSFSWSSPCW